MLSEEELNKRIEDYEQRNSTLKIECQIDVIEKLLKSDKKNLAFLYINDKVINYLGMDALENMIIETNDAYIIYKFADKFKDVNIEKLEYAIIKLKSCKYIYEFAKNINGVNIEKLENEMIILEDKEYMLKFAENVASANLYKFLYAFKKINDSEKYIKIKDKIFNMDESLMKIHNSDKSDTIKYLIENKNENNNDIKLRIYFSYLNCFNTSHVDLIEFDKEYLEYMCFVESQKAPFKNYGKKVKIKKLGIV